MTGASRISHDGSKRREAKESKRTLTFSEILPYMSGAMSCIKYEFPWDRRALSRASATEMPWWFEPFRRNLIVTLPPGR